MKSTDIAALIENHGLMVLLYGRSGSGKTRALLNLFNRPGILLCNEPRGLQTLVSGGLKEGAVKIVVTAQEMYDAALEAIATPHIQWIAVDSISRHYELVLQEYCERNGILPGRIKRNDWGAMSDAFLNLWEKLLVGTHAGLHVIVTCHEKEESDKDEGTSNVWFAPQLPGKLPERVLPQCAIILRNFKVEIGGQRKYKMSIPDGNSYGKDWTGQVGGPVDNDVTLLLGGVPPNGRTSERPREEETLATLTTEDNDQSKSTQEPQETPPTLIIYDGKEGTPDGETPVTQRDLRYLHDLSKQAGGDTSLLKTMIRNHLGLKFLKEIRIKHMAQLTLLLTKMIDDKDVDTTFGPEEKEGESTNAAS